MIAVIDLIRKTHKCRRNLGLDIGSLGTSGGARLQIFKLLVIQFLLAQENLKYVK